MAEDYHLVELIKAVLRGQVPPATEEENAMRLDLLRNRFVGAVLSCTNLSDDQSRQCRQKIGEAVKAPRFKMAPRLRVYLDE